MSDSCEVEDGQWLSIREAKRLYGIKPDHELMKYSLETGDDAVWEEFLNRFGKPGISRQTQASAPALAYTYAMYCIALREACEDPEKVIVVNHQPVHKAAAMTAANHRHSIRDEDVPY